MGTARLGIATLGCLALVACGESSDTPASKEKTPSVDFTFRANVGVGEEIQKCQFVRMPDDKGELAVGRVSHEYSPGSHHFLVYRTELTEIPAGGDTLVDCDESNWMSNVRGVIYAAQETDGEFALPKGVGQKFRAGEIMLVQTHYLNTSSVALDAQIDLRMELLDPAEVEQEAGVLFFFNPSIHLDPASKGSAELTCPIPEDLNLAFAASHMHKRGKYFRADSSDPAVAAAVGPLYESTVWAEPVPRVFPQEPPPMLPKGSTIRYRCDFDNPDSSHVVSGPSADTDEMCMFVSMYWPRVDQLTEFCRAGKVTNAGTASAVDTFACLAACGGGKGPECRAACWESACPSAPMPLMDFAFCLQEGCAAECVVDPVSDACKTCTEKHCPGAHDRFVNAPCN
jgi:hypothetical protein